MFCPRCGAEISDGSKFCPKCGEAILSSEQVTPEIASHVSDGVVESNSPNMVENTDTSEKASENRDLTEQEIKKKRNYIWGTCACAIFGTIYFLGQGGFSLKWWWWIALILLILLALGAYGSQDENKLEDLDAAKGVLFVGVVVVVLMTMFMSPKYPYSSLKDFQDEINGKTFVFDNEDNEGYWYKVVIHDDKAEFFAVSPSKGEWGEPSRLRCKYEIKRFSDTGKQYYAMSFGFLILFCPFEDTKLYDENSSKLGNGWLILGEEESGKMYLMRPDDSAPWD